MGVLREYLRRHPGGLEGLARAAGMSTRTIYELSDPGKYRGPRKVLERLAEAIAASEMSKKLDAKALYRLWLKERGRD